MAETKTIKTFRIGNEIQVRWPILTNGEESSLDGRDLTLILSDQWGNDREVKSFGTEGNVVVFTFLASEQFKTGVYRLTLFENMGKAHQLCTDYCFAFKLVAHSCDIPDDMAVEELPLDSTNVDVGIHGLSAYEIAVNYGYEGSEEQWMSEFNTVLSSTQLIMASVERAGEVLRRSEELFEGLSIIQASEQGRVDAETLRAQSESERVSHENQRVLDENARLENERQRVLAEEQRGQTFTNSQNQRQQTFEASEQQRGRDFASSEQQRQTNFEQSEQQRGQTATDNEQQRQGTFEQGESQRQGTFEENESQRESRVTEFVTDVQNAENARIEAEGQRVENETERQGKESTRRLNENTRIENETTRGQNESYRRSAENLRVSHEQERVENEILRQRNETLRLQQDDVIAEAETLRSASETRRVQSESERVSAEQARANAETQRAQAELKREQDTTNAINGIASQIESKHQEYQQTLNETVSQAQSDVQTAINDFNRTRRVIQTESEVEINPNVKNIWSSPIPELTITFAAGVQGYDNEYMIEFTCPSDAATVLTLPSGLRWMDDDPLQPQPGYTYQISIIDNLAVFAGWEAATT